MQSLDPSERKHPKVSTAAGVKNVWMSEIQDEGCEFRDLGQNSGAGRGERGCNWTTRCPRPQLSEALGFAGHRPPIPLSPASYRHRSPIFVTWSWAKGILNPPIRVVTILFAAWFASKRLCIFYTASLPPFHECLLRPYYVPVAENTAMNEIDKNAQLCGSSVLTSRQSL